jgi:hypothetical protein
LSITFTTKSVLAISATGVLVALTPGVSAFASPVCSAGGTLLSSGVCELKFTQPGSHTFTPTSTITKIDALIVGAGGAGDQVVGNSAYAGGGGDVKLVSLLTTGVAATIVVGAGSTGTDSSANDSSVTQAATTTTASGGHSPTNYSSGTSGNGNGGYSNWGSFPVGGANGYGLGYGGGAGAGALATSQIGGTGLVVNALAGASTSLFSDDTTCYGGGGSGGGYANNHDIQVSVLSGESVCGGGGVTVVTNGITFTSYTMTTPRANSGSGGAKYFKLVNQDPASIVSQPGADGIVVIRYEDTATTSDSALANTGSTGLAETFAAGLGFLTLGFAALAVRRTRRTSNR